MRYKLSCSLFGHKLDVRCVAATANGCIVSGSRDKTVKIWSPNENGGGYKEINTLGGHDNFVSCLCIIPCSSKNTEGLIITGSNDHAIRVFEPSNPMPLYTLKSHSNTVCRIVSSIEDGIIFSSSWDQTCKMWSLEKKEVLSTLKGHQGAVWSIIQLLSGLIVTVSADKTVKLWLKDGTCLKTLSGHTDCVRDVASAGPDEFLTCSNDATVKLWNAKTGECLQTYHSHSNFIYSISTFFGGDVNDGFLTSSEDKTVNIWSLSGEVLQTIQLPAYSVWTVAALPNGDIITGSSDGIVRIFTAEPSRQANDEQLKAYEDQIISLSSSGMQEIGGVKVSDLPGKESLYEPGRKDGQTKLVREGSTVVAYSWSMSEGCWNKIGDVMGNAGQNETGKTLHNGKEYDYVFSVDIEEGSPPLKLPYNRSEDPWFVAQKFIHDNNLSQYYLEQVANFIISNSSGNPANVMPHETSSFIDPFTGGARYIPQGNSHSNGVQGNNSDPFTGGSSYTTSSNFNSSQSIYFPQREFLRFDQANLAMILEKLLEFNKQMGDFSDNELEDLIQICEPGTTCTQSNIKTLNQLLQWPQDLIFPVLDVMRLAIRNADVNYYLCTDTLLPCLSKFIMPPSGSPNNMLALRVLSNMMAEEPGQKIADRYRINILHLLKSLNPPFTKQLQVAMTTLLLNICVIIRRSETPEGRVEAFDTANLMHPVINDEEALFRWLVAVGTLLNDFVDKLDVNESFKSILLKLHSNTSFGSRITDCAIQIFNILL